jgi:cellulose synthase/poly-beta-1,6-N-acetylglucosamine synthase-like glycosyltransferase
MAAAIVHGLEMLGWVILGSFSLHCLWLLIQMVRCGQPPKPAARFDRLPFVTVQLPIYNERHVAGRLLDAVEAFDYPADRIEIQVLDDSTDDTVDIIREKVEALSARGVQVRHIHRTHRAGFKAGALAEGLLTARGEFLALFDADFVPPPDFLRQTIDYFTDPSIGMVQTRWGHLNRGHSFLTRAQAIMLDGHFLIEQVARSRGGTFFNFNGSAGIWRRRTIDDAGGWHPDTLTEDLDLSYRAQLRGWRFVYLPDLVVPGELPVDMGSLKSQHHRWAKGSIQTALKLLPTLLRSRQPWWIKLEACFHFGHWAYYPLGLLVSLLILPELIISSRSPFTADGPGTLRLLANLLLLTTASLFYGVSQRRAGSSWLRMLAEMPLLMAVGAGLALNNTRAIWEALRGIPSQFHRTPKRGHASGRLYRPHPSQAKGWWTEIALGLYVGVALGYAASESLYAVMPFLVPLSTGFLYAGLSSFQPGHFTRPAAREVGWSRTQPAGDTALASSQAPQSVS